MAPDAYYPPGILRPNAGYLGGSRRGSVQSSSYPSILGVNLLIGSGIAVNAPYNGNNWSLLNITETDGQTDPFGGTSAALFTDNATAAQHYLSSNTLSPSTVAGQLYQLSGYFKPGTYTAGPLSIWAGSQAKLNFNPTTFVASDGGGSVTMSNLSSTAVANGFYKVTGQYTATGAASQVYILFDNAVSYAGTGQTFTFYGFALQAVL